MKFVYGWGGAIVIIGALFKILHLPGAGFWLTFGLLTEAAIFFISAFEPLHADPDWALVYPELAMGHSDQGLDELPESLDDLGDDLSLTEQLDTMLADAKIEPELIESLGVGMKALSDNANQLGEVSGASTATNNYIESLDSASAKMGQLSDAYDSASESLAGLTNAKASSDAVGEQMEKVSGNLAALNNVYEMQLKGASEHLEATEQMYSGINELMGNLHGSIDDTRMYKETMGELSKNLSALNTVYGNMLSAMNVGRD
ncbi:MAG: gliding motility protein GldL [Crocinitomicaceae bacterium]|nr:gliding motility protein GldL [Crocinitomicaceae bacterium]